LFRKSLHLTLITILLLALAACTAPLQPTTLAPTLLPPSATPIPSATPVPTLVPSASPVPSATAAPTLAPTLVPSGTPISTQGWLVYKNSAYGFSFQYPQAWTVAEDLRPASTSFKHALWLQPKADALTRLVIGFKRSGESAGIGRTSLGQGELVERGTLTFLKQEITVRALVDRGKDRTLLYGSGEIQRGTLFFTLFLDYLGDPTKVAGLSELDEAVAARIIASLTMN